MEHKLRPNPNYVSKNRPILVVRVVMYAENANYMIKRAFYSEFLPFKCKKWPFLRVGFIVGFLGGYYPKKNPPGG